MTELLSWTQDHATVLGLVTLASVSLLCLTVFLTPWLVTRLPANYFVGEETPPRGSASVRLIVKVIRNIAGTTIMAAGLLMLVMPGPGLLTVLVGLSLSDFTAKKRWLRKLLRQPSVLRSLNWMRARANKPPFQTG